MIKPLPVVAAIPNYNMAESLQNLLEQVIEQGYDEIYVLDDHSSDDSRTIVESFGNKVQLVGGDINVGAGNNRNRIISALEHESIIHFIDADMVLQGNNIVETIRQVVEEYPEAGFIGGLVLEDDGRQFIFNFGPRLTLTGNLAAGFLQAVYRVLGKRFPKGARFLMARARPFLGEWPNPYNIAMPQEVFWTSEANLIVNSRVFSEFGGYDPKMREHEIQDLSLRMHAKGLKAYFDPRVAAIHTAVQVRSGNRRVEMYKAQVYFVQKHRRSRKTAKRHAKS